MTPISNLAMYHIDQLNKQIQNEALLKKAKEELADTNNEEIADENAEG